MMSIRKINGTSALNTFKWEGQTKAAIFVKVKGEFAIIKRKTNA